MDVLRLDTCQEEASLCQASCPAGVDIRRYMHSLQHGNVEEAIGFIRETLPFPAVTGRVCFHPCETNCARKEVDEAVNINTLERFVADYWLKEKAKPALRLHVAKVAIVGSGPAGLSCAYFLTGMGYPVTVFESMAECGGMLRAGIAEHRLPRNILDAQIDYIREMGAEFKTGTTIGGDVTVEDLRDNGYKAVFFGVGTQLSSKLAIDGVDLEGVTWGLDFLRGVNLKRQAGISGNVLVIGGGDVAMDAASAALRMGAQKVEVVCLEAGSEMPAHEDSIKQAIDEGVDIHPCWGPKKIQGKDGKVTGVAFDRCVSVKDGEGMFCPSFDKGTNTFIKADTVIFAVGQRPDLALLPQEIKTTERGTIAADSITLETSVPGVFAGGDAVSGPASVVESIRDGRTAAISVDRYLKGEDLKEGRKGAISSFPNSPKDGMPTIVRQVAPLLPVDRRRRNFREIKLGFSKDMALREAQRCMTCGSKARIAYNEDCMVCFECALSCPAKAVTVSFTPGFVAPSIDYSERGKR